MEIKDIIELLIQLTQNEDFGSNMEDQLSALRTAIPLLKKMDEVEGVGILPPKNMKLDYPARYFYWGMWDGYTKCREEVKLRLAKNWSVEKLTKFFQGLWNTGKLGEMMYQKDCLGLVIDFKKLAQVIFEMIRGEK